MALELTRSVIEAAKSGPVSTGDIVAALEELVNVIDRPTPAAASTPPWMAPPPVRTSDAAP